MKVELRWRGRRAELRYPAGRAPRTAVLVNWVRGKGSVRVFPGGWCEEAAAFEPQAIAATWPQFCELMQSGIAAPERAIVVLARPGGALITEEQRDQLWRAFRVPAFEQWIGMRGELVAAECEGHAGLHIESGTLERAAFEIDESRCPCGRPEPRLIAPATRRKQTLRAVAAYAR